ncbi:DgyrCDS1246 [Dimorphilus gyrociliatus]|uniref:Ubiquitin carboxyl-terminal hydrolase n=1 Tax=Dimorphilus gyrociliatus TaxID=2664684 RepID=A0A7I8V858_9ANNE|nr:DgyrCDS1246 [Dimorphilus gyrociliatus]
MNRSTVDTNRSKYSKTTGRKRSPDLYAIVRNQKLPPLPYSPSKTNPTVETRKIPDYSKSTKPFFEADERFITTSKKYPDVSRPRRDSFDSRGSSARATKRYLSTNLINVSEPSNIDRRRSDSTDRLTSIKLGGDTNNNYRSKSFEKKANNNTPRTNRNCGLKGLRNLGNTCFMNSIIQCLSNTKLLREYCFYGNYENDINKKSSMKGNLIRAFSDLLKQLWSDSSASISPRDFKEQIGKFSSRFDGYSQHDSQEFLLYLLEGLHNDLNLSREKEKRYIDSSDNVDSTPAAEKAEKMWKLYKNCEKSKIVDIFVGQLQSSLKCDKCSYTSNTFEPLWMLHLPLTGQSSKLETCLSQFTKEEVLDRDEKPMCAKCKCRQKSHKKFSIRRFPKVLIIQLKRFQHGSYLTSKLNSSINYPTKGLNMQGHASDGVSAPIYDLYAVSNHSGSPQYGHYTADALNSETGTWHHFNDSIVSTIYDSSVVTENGYVLFYVSRERTEL